MNHNGALQQLLAIVLKQAMERAASGHLPEGYAQAVVINGRGHKITSDQGVELFRCITVESDGIIAQHHIWIDFGD